ncbi:hypothetical protein GDO81_007299 [Engystomops pustulosus]|uniref:Uncharacterized protein n=1 Tax=Engystomops pustulosus TaxID=76066 RepID=A0AAV7C6Z8_ENGPU|nr:hypothetical protein GDO81_007299 [Engystomops pustulosus]
MASVGFQSVDGDSLTRHFMISLVLTPLCTQHSTNQTHGSVSHTHTISYYNDQAPSLLHGGGSTGMNERHVSSRIPALILCDIIQCKCLTESKAVTSEGKHKIQASMRTHSFGAKQDFPSA